LKSLPPQTAEFFVSVTSQANGFCFVLVPLSDDLVVYPAISIQENFSFDFFPVFPSCTDRMHNVLPRARNRS
jgi:hypothetical protein